MFYDNPNKPPDFSYIPQKMYYYLDDGTIKYDMVDSRHVSTSIHYPTSFWDIANFGQIQHTYYVRQTPLAKSDYFNSLDKLYEDMAKYTDYWKKNHINIYSMLVDKAPEYLI
jgi:hypothetical protein